MTLTLVAALLGIALVDSLNPSALVVTTLFLAGRDPYRRSLAYIVGIFVTYYVVGVAVILGAGGALAAVFDTFRRPEVGSGSKRRSAWCSSSFVFGDGSSATLRR